MSAINTWRAGLFRNLKRLEAANMREDPMTIAEKKLNERYEKTFLNNLVILGAERMKDFDDIWQRYENIDILRITGRE